METPEIIDGLKDLVKDRDSFIDQNSPDNVFEHDKEVLKAAIDALSAPLGNKSLTCEGCRNKGQFEPLVKYGLPSPCTGCKRRSPDRYSANTPEMEEL